MLAYRLFLEVAVHRPLFPQPLLAGGASDNNPTVRVSAQLWTSEVLSLESFSTSGQKMVDVRKPHCCRECLCIVAALIRQDSPGIICRVGFCASFADWKRAELLSEPRNEAACFNPVSETFA